MRLSHPKVEGVLQASKWLSHRALLDSGEMQSLLTSLPPFSIYNVSELVDLQNFRISIEDFLVRYVDYITTIKAGLVPDETFLKPYFSAAFSARPQSLYAMKVKEGKYIVKPIEPVVQLSLHHFTFSHDQEAFHSMVHSKNAVTWGLQFSYPQLYSNSLTNDLVEVYKDRENPNTKLFQTLAKWMRAHTTPTPFLVEGKPLNATFRLGKRSHVWAKLHPQLEHFRLTL
ncbi:MAG: hypothetical protein KDK64_06565 [Chlamydiia bacterium]|nr:hypothetical protein [Chlamydiia bacterium]